MKWAGGGAVSEGGPTNCAGNERNSNTKLENSGKECQLVCNMTLKHWRAHKRLAIKDIWEAAAVIWITRGSIRSWQISIYIYDAILRKMWYQSLWTCSLGHNSLLIWSLLPIIHSVPTLSLLIYPPVIFTYTEERREHIIISCTSVPCNASPLRYHGKSYAFMNIHE